MFSVLPCCHHLLSHHKAPLYWRHNGPGGVSNHQPHHCLLNRLFGRRSRKTSKLRITGLCAGNSTVTGEFPAQMASNAENVSIWWRHHAHRNSQRTYYNTQIDVGWGGVPWGHFTQHILKYNRNLKRSARSVFYSIIQPGHNLHMSRQCRDKIATISQTIFWNAFTWMKVYEFRLYRRDGTFLLNRSPGFARSYKMPSYRLKKRNPDL